MIKCLVLLSCFGSIALARSATSSLNTITDEKDTANNIVASAAASAQSTGKSESTTSSIWDDFDFVYRTYQSCGSTDLSVCLKLKLVTAMDRAARSMQSVNIMNGIRFVKVAGGNDDEKAAPSSPIANEEELMLTLPRSTEGKESALTSLLWNRVSSFFKSHTLQVKFPSLEELQRRSNDNDDDDDDSDDEEVNKADHQGRGKGKKDKGGFVMIPLLLGSTIIPIAYGALALLAGKALIVSKLALVLASIIGIKKLVSHSGGSGETSRNDVNVVGGSDRIGSGWGRDFDLAYRPLRN